MAGLAGWLGWKASVLPRAARHLLLRWFLDRSVLSQRVASVQRSQNTVITRTILGLIDVPYGIETAWSRMHESWFNDQR